MAKTASNLENDSLGLYVHVPFCLSKCDYCGFYSIPPTPGGVSDYLNRLAEEVSLSLTPARVRRINTVFIGGGNPTSIGYHDFRKLLQTLTDKLVLSRIEEWTIETNPETWASVGGLAAGELPGLRVSMGFQRFEDDELTFLGRRGSLSHGMEAVEDALKLTENVGIDLILGVPEFPSLAQKLGLFVGKVPVKHVSAYFLSCEKGTPYEHAVDAGERANPAEAGPEELFEVRDVLQREDFEHYEISNFSKPGFRCRHNMNYWNLGEYLGVGPSAVGTLGGSRTSNPASLDEWVAGRRRETEALSALDCRREFIMLRLRLLSDGLDLDEFSARFGPPSPSLTETLKRELESGFLIESESCFRLSAKGISFANQVISRLF